MRKLLLLVPVLCCLITYAQPKRYVVAADGSGQFTSVQKAFDAIPTNNKKLVVIYVKKGTFGIACFFMPSSLRSTPIPGLFETVMKLFSTHSPSYFTMSLNIGWV